MIDFIEYVVAELKSKRLSKTNAVALVKQFWHRSSGPAAAAVIHPLLHRNTSDLTEQRYSSTFGGDEFFLADHRVQVGGSAARKVLPGVVYLEMARAAIEQAWPARPESTVLELRNVVWAQPVVVDGSRQVSIALWATAGEQIEFEIYSQDGEQEIVHCQGVAVPVSEPAAAALNVQQLETQLPGTVEPASVYATCTRMGLLYGPSFQGITSLRRGSGQVLAHLRLPDVVAGKAAGFVLHPSLMDGALQAAVGLLGDDAASEPRVPFALESLRIVSPSTPAMVAWLRFAPGSNAGDAVTKLDIDLCDERGNVCVQLRGFSSRVVTKAIKTISAGSEAEYLLARPVWQASDASSAAVAAIDYAEHDIVLCELPHVDSDALQSLLPHEHCLRFETLQTKSIGQCYGDYGIGCFELVQAILHGKPAGKVLVQIAVADDQEHTVLAGLSGLLRTAALENPQFIGQVILVPSGTTAAGLAPLLRAESARAQTELIRYTQGTRHILGWQEVAATPEAVPVAFKENSVYLITGGLGGVGVLFAKEIVERTQQARVILTGRSTLDAEKQKRLDELSAGSRVTYRQLDLANLEEVTSTIAAIRDEYGQLNGVLHSAGMTADSYILKKGTSDFAEVLGPKVTGTCNLDEATRDVALDFFVVFSALAGVTGNSGQADYAAANGFMDHFAAYRNRLVVAKQRHGLTRAIDWPLWQAGGMRIDAASRELLQQTTGMRPMQTATGINAFHRSLALPYDQLLVVEGELAQTRRAFLGAPAIAAEPPTAQPQPVVAADAESLGEKTEEYLRKQLSGLLKLPAHEIDPRAAMENYGIDSILAMKLTNQLEKTFGSLSKTLFFEYQTIRELAGYFTSAHATQLTSLLMPVAEQRVEVVPPAAPVAAAPSSAPVKGVTSRRAGRQRSAAAAPAAVAKTEAGPIAIVGLSGRYPEAVDVDAYWVNLRDGKDCIVEVPKERWDWREYFSDDRSKTGQHYSKWGGFISGVDEFDPLFFNISPADAELIDPQERLFLQHAWHAVEDAGYTRASLQVPHEGDLPGQVGVYVGLMYTEYQLFGAEASARGRRMGIADSPASIANRVSYALNLHGPSMTIDTMCSSSLSAMHIACQDLKEGRISLALAGGANVSIHPNKYLVLSAGQFISGDGHCQSFGEGGDGYIPGEGVGVVVLKRLADAERDGDHIYGVIRGSALNHGGKTNGYTVPNPQAQASAISRALADAKLDARHISYIEAHGTGTKLGDPIEITALSKAFNQHTKDTGFCLIGSAKSNIGHCESAAGIAGVTKVLLQMQHRQIVPSLHSTQLNPHIDFDKSPFVVNQTLRPWEQPVIDGRALPRIAGISSFGAGGSNAHMLIEEYQAPVRQPVAFAPAVILLSAKTPEQLRQKAIDLLAYVQPRVASIDLVDVAYTLQVGREAMEERLGFVAGTAAELVEKLRAYVAGERGLEDTYQGQVKRNNDTLALFGTDSDLQQAMDRWIGARKVAKLLELWVKGLEVDWSKLYGDARPRRMSLPLYPFARERYWIDVAVAGEGMGKGATAVLHPLLHSNTSDLSEQRYSTTFTGEEFFLADHQVQLGGEASRKVLPGVAYLEMARAAIEHALPAQSDPVVLELLDTVWAQPIVVNEPKQVSIALLASEHDRIDYEVFSQDGDAPVVHCQGRAAVSRTSAPAPLDLEGLRSQMTEGVWDAARLYATCARLGLVYGPSFQGVTAIHQGCNQLLVDLRLPQGLEASANAYVLHPSIVDGALQAAAGLTDGATQTTQPRLPFAIDSLRVVAPCTASMVAWVRYASHSQPGDAVVKLDIDLCDERGNVCAQMRGLSSRVVSVTETPSRSAVADSHRSETRVEDREIVLATPVWQTREPGSPRRDVAEHHIVLCELPNVDTTKLASLLPQSDCVALTADVSMTLAQRYSEYAVACFERIRGLLQRKPQGRLLFQVVAAGDGEQTVYAGLSALLKTAALENPQFAGQLLLVPSSTTTEELAQRLAAEQTQSPDALVRIAEGTRQVFEWQAVAVQDEKPAVAFRDTGVYLITGGFGGLGVLFAQEILRQTAKARVILTGRSPLAADKQARLTGLSGSGRLTYRQLDLGDAEQVKRVIASILYDHGKLNGILHSAGMIADGFILTKTSADFTNVLAPKVTGTFNLDQASRVVGLDFFVLFSSTAGATGSAGQADYATANGFMDHFAAHRNRQVAAKQRHGRTLSVNWPLWQAGGMTIDASTQELLYETTGIRPLQTAAGLDAFHRILPLPHDQMLVVEGNAAKIRRTFLDAPAETAPEVAQPPAIVATTIDAATIEEKTQDYLRRELAALLKMPSQKIDPQAELEEYGIDSILAVKLTNQLEKTFGPLSKTLFFEYRTIHDLAGYFVTQHAAQITALLAPAGQAPAAVVPVTLQTPAAPAKLVSSRRFSRAANTAPTVAPETDAIAIIGLSGRYPEAVDLEAYWANLRDGKDCITEVPKSRWDWREYFSDDRGEAGRHYSKWGGFISGVDEFDPLFFNISPAGAELIDPQERLFLQYAWMAMEDAGYTRTSLQAPHANDLPGQVGVYAGVMYNEYQLFGAESGARGKRLGVPGSTASIANRVSYALDLHGPSVTLDTMCSSSLTAIHFACQDLKLGRTSMAIAGGVNVTIHPNKYLVLSAGQFISSDGHCQSFGEGGDGYIPGEGVGVVILKRLSDAKRDGDHIYGVIRGSALNHGGKTNGYTVPSPQAQASAIGRALTEAHVDARHISYVEAHGTGTTLGDPIEIAALGKAFGQYTQDTGFCLVGSAKSNIGHCESAAGIAGLTKVLLQMQHRQVVPSLHSAQLNPHIDFAKTPFTVNQTLRPWEQPVVDGRPVPRIAGLSSFGAGGSNAHLIIEEYQEPVRQPVATANVAILLSARNGEQLREKAQDLLGYVNARGNSVELAAMAFTLQTGREAMEERLGFVAGSVEQIAEKLQAYLDGEENIEDLWQGHARRTMEVLSLFDTDADLKQAIDRWIAGGKLAKLLELWANGVDVDWSKAYGDSRPPRISMPTYPFAKERYWIDVAAATVTSRNATAVLHPLLHSNTSDLSEQRYSSTFTGEEFFLADHRVQGSAGVAQKILPAVAQLEMARAAIEQAAPAQAEGMSVELRNVVWAEPIVAHSLPADQTRVSIALLPSEQGEIDYEIYSEAGEQDVVHGQGRAVPVRQAQPAALDLTQLAQRMGEGRLAPDALYAACTRMGLLYGPAFQGVSGVHRGNDELLVQLRLPRSVEETAADYVLHPAMLDGALHACVALLDDVSGPRVPFALEALRILAPCGREMTAWVRYSAGSNAADAVVKLDVDLCDTDGNVAVQLRGLSSRVLSRDIGLTAAPEQAFGWLIAAPRWETSVAAIRTGFEPAEHHVVLCELPDVEIAALEAALPRGRFATLQSEPRQTIAERYGAYAVACFERIQTILQAGPQAKVLFQIAVGNREEATILAGLSALLKSAALENPQFIGQLLLVPPHVNAEVLAQHLRAEQSLAADPLVRYDGNARQLLRWHDVPVTGAQPTAAFKDNGVYLITGGLGGLGVLFAKEILARSAHARVILTGRAELAAEKWALLDSLSADAERVAYRQLDLNDLEQVTALVANIGDEYHQLDGILHSAGMTADHFIRRKTISEFTQVLAPKVTGTYNLDHATRDLPLDFFVLFSSVAGALGNLGQADYAAANGFMDHFAAYRNRQVTARQRQGRTLSINWPLWQAGGMGIDPANRELLQQTTGMRPMETATGIEAFHRSLALPYDQTLVVEGNLTQMRRVLAAGRPVPPATSPRPVEAPVTRTKVPVAAGPATLVAKAEDYLRRELSELLKLPAHKIDPRAALENYGIDSILAMKLTNQLEKTFGSLSKTLFFEYHSLAALAGYFVKAHADVLRATFTDDGQRTTDNESAVLPIAATKPPAPARRKKQRFAGASSSQGSQPKEIAIVGLAGRYPQAETLQDFWRNLQHGRDCITEVPSDRWNHDLYFDADPAKRGKSYSKWGGFLADVDKFDPLFFNISPREAAAIDPQERLFLQTAWQTIEDAGYTREALAGGRVGVYVGVMWGQYELFGAESVLRGNSNLTSSSYASVANRVSYFFDFHGPSIALDTMCSSSLTAIHLACEALRKGDLDAAIAGGVNLSIHPYKYLSLSQGKFVATDGRCRSFGEGGDGYVPGEGVGAVLLKPLEDALRDGDQIYAVVRSTALNHGGKTNGYSVPNPNAQADLVRDALSKAQIEPRTLSYIETHGTGTSLGDPIEITGLSKAFEATDEKQFCPIGSVKSNIGHLEAAAGIAAVTKALLQIRHKQLVPSLHAEPGNPNIDFAGTPFYVQTELAEWKRPDTHPRRAGVSSFGAGGSNAHLILEEHASAAGEAEQSASVSPELFVLSARSTDALERYAATMAESLRSASDRSLPGIAYTSQVGRTVMDVRLAIVASDVEELAGKLTRWLATRRSDDTTETEGVFHGDVRQAGQGAAHLIDGVAGQAFLDELLASRDLDKLARLWVLGTAVDWSHMPRYGAPKRVSLPTYPFAKERCWIEPELPLLHAAAASVAAPVKALVVERVEEKQRTYYTPRWIEHALASAEMADAPAGPVLILDTSENLSLALREQLASGLLHRDVVLVTPGTSHQEVAPAIFVIDPEREEQFHQLVATLEERGQLPRVIIHHAADACDLEVSADVERTLRNGAYTLLQLTKALLRSAGAATAQTPLRILSLFSTHAEATAPLSAALGGFLATVTLEHPACQTKLIELRNDGTTTEPGQTGVSVPHHVSADEARILLAEASDANWSAREVLYRRMECADTPVVPPSLTRYVTQLAEASIARQTPLPLKHHGVYLITGGLGGVGLVFAEYLASRYQAKLVLVGRSAPNPRNNEMLLRLQDYGAELLCLQGDVADRAQIEAVVEAAKERFTAIDGVIHAGGVNRDAFILRKSVEEMAAVLAAKVSGTINLDLATRGEPLGCFVLFSSIAGVLGNPGQCDYAFGNCFLDAFAAHRESLRNDELRSGRTLSIDWPLWDGVGMSMPAEELALLEERTGLAPLPAQEGLAYWEDFLRSDLTQGIALYGTPSKIAAALAQRSVQPQSATRPAATPDRTADRARLLAATETYLKALVGEEIKLSPERIGSNDRFESFGIDSVMINHLNATLENDLGPLPKTLFYEHETVADLARFLLQQVPAPLTALLRASEPPAPASEPAPEPVRETAPPPVVIAPLTPRIEQPQPDRHGPLEPIAIIGIHGDYPHSSTADEYWANLREGKDLIDVVPANRWSYESFFNADPKAAADGQIYCKWGGFLDGFDKFDPHFFHISTAEAKVMDPQERLFLQSVWAALEDAGYTRDSLRTRYPKGRSANVGVFVGVTTNSYHLCTPADPARGEFVSPTAMPWSIANRVSYFFDFNGPSLPVDTACSSSSVAIHLACESLRNRECQVAVAGGVNLYLHPSKYQSLCQRRMLSADGKTHSYGAGDDGFVPGEGVGTVILKPLSKAMADGDHIYAVVRASAFDHSGRSNGYSAPNPNSQATLISHTLDKARIHPETIGYVEGHGTGTQLGDSLEIAALTQAFRKQTAKKRFCSIGCVKANIGHSESAAGIAGVAKVLLQLEHGQLAPSIHSEEPNPNIDLDDSPFYLQHGLAGWTASSHPRRALINSFGAGGVNACLLLEEHQTPAAASHDAGPRLFVLSARNEERLRAYVERILARLRRDVAEGRAAALADLCYTLQTGREAMDERLATVVSNVDELIARLDDWSYCGTAADVHRGTLDPRRAAKRSSRNKALLGDHTLGELAARWIAGGEIDWDSLYTGATPRRISAPGYPFARERYWAADTIVPERQTLSASRLHPLVAFNSSTVKEVSFSSSLSDTAFYAVDHKVNDESIFPGAGFLEMACISGNIGGAQKVRRIKDVVWIRPLRFGAGAQQLRTVLRPSGNEIEYEISSFDDDCETVVHSEGRLAFTSGEAEGVAQERVMLETLKAQCARADDGAAFYGRFDELGLHYGPSFRTVQELYVGGTFALAKLKIAEHLKGEFSQFVLHPSLIDGALQTVAGLVGSGGVQTPYLPFALDEILIIRPVPQTCYALAERADAQAASHAGVTKFNILLLSEQGDVLVKFTNLYVRPLPRPTTNRHSIATADAAPRGRVVSLIGE
ncbi:MAG TPA: SDR family NAD(P)-dependent oxidoreductase [Thermoanaerobaculia bacterium]|jgi:polyketide synthase PksN